MQSPSQIDNERVLKLIGAIVLVSQDAERYLKFVLPFKGRIEDPSLRASLDSYPKLKKRTLGELTGKFLDSTESESMDLSQHLAGLIDARNKVVHHFNETYGQRIVAGDLQFVYGSLEALLSNLKIFRSVTEQLALVVLSGLRDFTFKETPEYEKMVELCDSFRRQIAS
jgi:hypothetical protein